ncbi:hypothetical protein PA10_00162 [Pseudomonas phage pPa_SNUABM_DT01]|nr:hypothetical protein PA10_00162 [Pseudomonas phage pPa_SNUABM_DT01]
MGQLRIKEATLSMEVGAKGHFCVDSLFSDREIDVIDQLSVRLDEKEIQADNPKFDITIKDNHIHYVLKEGQNSWNDTISFTAYFDQPVNWHPHR